MKPTKTQNYLQITRKGRLVSVDVTKTGNGEWGMGNGEWGMGNGEWEMENGEWGMGNGEWEIENGKWEIENGKLIFFHINFL